MSKAQLNAIVTTALLDEEFKAAILNGQRRARLTAFPLTKKEEDAVLAIKSPDWEQFVGHIVGLLQASDWQQKLPVGESSHYHS